jgi:hypothetical protein
VTDVHIGQYAFWKSACSGEDAQTGHPTRPQQFLTCSQKGGLVDPRLRAFREQEDDQATLPALFQHSQWQGVENYLNAGLGHVMDGSSRARRLFKKTVQQGRSR